MAHSVENIVTHSADSIESVENIAAHPTNSIEDSADRGQIKSSSKTEYTKLAEQLEKTNRFLESSIAAIEIDNLIDKMTYTPTINPKKRIYETVIFNFKLLFRSELRTKITESVENNTSLQEAAKKLQGAWRNKLQEIAGADNKISFLNLTPKKVYSPEVRLMLIDSNLLQKIETLSDVAGKQIADPKNPDPTKNIAEKKQFIVEYLKSWAEKAVGKDKNKTPLVGSGINLAREAQAILREMIGKNHLSKKDFDDTWKEVMKDKNVQTVWNEKSGENAIRAFENLLEKDPDELKSALQKETDHAIIMAREAKFNPYGFALRKHGDLFGVLLYTGKDILIGTLLLGAALTGLNPKKMISSAPMIASAAAIFGITKYYNPNLFAKESLDKKTIRQNLEHKILNLEANSPVRKWLAVFSKKEIVDNKKLGKFFEQKPEERSLDQSFRNCFPQKTDLPETEIRENTDQRQFFTLLESCFRRGIGPKKTLNA